MATACSEMFVCAIDVAIHCAAIEGIESGAIEENYWCRIMCIASHTKLLFVKDYRVVCHIYCK